jgi:hypothetical protein
LENHYSDEDLLSHLDGEISKRKRKIISQHLEFCWICRARQAELETQIQLLSAHIQNLAPNPDWQYSTRQKIAAFEEQFESRLRVSRRSAFLGKRRWMFAASLGICATAMMLFFLWRTPMRPGLAPSLVVQHANEAAVKLAEVPVHQVFHINEVQIRPLGTRRESRLEIWSDGPSRRFASKWTGSGGLLKHAIWDNGAKSPLIYTSRKLQPFPRKNERKGATAFAIAEPNLDSLEAQFMRWLEERPWSPVALLPDVSLWEGAGAIMRVERLSSRQIRLFVQRKKAGIRVEFTALFGISDSLPRLQTLKVESAERVVEFQLSSERIDTVPSFSPAVFYPDRTLGADVPAQADFTQPRRKTAPTAGDDHLDFKPSADIRPSIRAVQAHYILHLVGACRGISVRVLQEAEGAGVFSENQAGEPQQEYFTSEAGVAEIMGALAEIRHFQEHAFPESVDRARIALLIRDANALAMLANVFDQSVVHQLPPSSLRLVREMVKDHAANLRDNLAKASTAFGGVADDGSNAPDSNEAKDWWSAASLLAEQVRGLESSSSRPESLQIKLIQMRRTSLQIDGLFQKEIANEQRTASLHGIQTGHGK